MINKMITPERYGQKISMRGMKSTLLCTGMTGLMTISMPAVMAQGAPSFDLSCRGGGDVRQILVVAPGEKGAACDVIYTRDRGLTSTTPYYANSDINFCFDKAALIRDKLKSSNYECSGAGLDRKAQVKQAVTVEPQPVSVASQETVAAANEASEKTAQELANVTDETVTNVVPDQLVSDTQEALSNREAFLRRLKSADTKAPVVAKAGNANIEVPVAAPVTKTAASDLVRNQSAIAIANTGPVTLVTPALTAETETSSKQAASDVPAQSRSDAANKFVGATPVVLASSQPDREVVQPAVIAPEAASSVTLAVPQTDAVSAPSAGGLLSSVVNATRADKPRSRPDIIRATLTAQAAAWNEGDVEAFMEGYWRDPDLRFVSGTEVSKGWNNTLKRYKKRYGNGAALGQLMFENMDVQMVTEDVAIVVGRFDLARSGTQHTGLFTLVMKRFEGAWRIVHDHTVADTPVIPPAEQVE